MAGPTPLTRLDTREQRRMPIVTVVPYVLLAVLTVFTAILKSSDAGSLLVDLGLCALAGAWMLWMFTLHPAWRERSTEMAVFFVGLLMITAVLVARDSWFGFFTPAAYIYAFSLLRWPWRLLGVAAVAVVAGTAQASGVDKSTPLGWAIVTAILAVNVLIMSAATWVGWVGDKQNDQRIQALADLEEANRRLESTLAENAGLHEQLVSQAREAGVLDERHRMAREIHDILAQGFTGIIAQLQAAEQSADDPDRWRRHVSASIALARESLTEARRSVHALRPEVLRTARLSEALADVAGRWSALHGVPVEVTTTGTTRPMSPEAEFALLRTAQEALANVAKHARANRVGVTLSYMEHEVVLDVRDDGGGFEPDGLGEGTAAHGGFGLAVMRQRIEDLSGTLQIESEPGAGTGISACVPASSAGDRR
ncbi:sensor histidine kinase [Actinomadura verrucosospora]|uniref:Oxygen sensor histidine kinase NreB n=1 Tax=Actinomadura verrucosospora TaxID=46165 RepID=A0A7D3VP19_ACTVE|nr:sensor histidine kinase [Actinomadura verrucosospora]QKG19175.1 histidine kinase [Actinomadura verrucosospora]